MSKISKSKLFQSIPNYFKSSPKIKIKKFIYIFVLWILNNLELITFIKAEEIVFNRL